MLTWNVWHGVHMYNSKHACTHAAKASSRKIGCKKGQMRSLVWSINQSWAGLNISQQSQTWSLLGHAYWICRSRTPNCKLWRYYMAWARNVGGHMSVILYIMWIRHVYVNWVVGRCRIETNFYIHRTVISMQYQSWVELSHCSNPFVPIIMNFLS